MATKLTPSRTSTYERPFTREGKYLVYLVVPQYPTEHIVHSCVVAESYFGNLVLCQERYSPSLEEACPFCPVNATFNWGNDLPLMNFIEGMSSVTLCICALRSSSLLRVNCSPLVFMFKWISCGDHSHNFGETEGHSWTLLSL